MIHGIKKVHDDLNVVYITKYIRIMRLIPTAAKR